MKKNTRIALKIDLILQAILLLFIIISLGPAIFEKSWLILTLLGLAILGIVQIVSVFCFIAWLNDMVRVKYLVACLIYGVVFIVVNFTLKNSVWQIIITTLSLPMALFYFWHSWQFYKKYKMNV